MTTVDSKDGTRIAYDKQGDGPLAILVDGALANRAGSPMIGLVPLLAGAGFSAVHYDRRGRNESGDSEKYDPEREIEDIEALLDAEGGSAYLFGSSSGAVLAAMAASTLGEAKVGKLALHEPSFILDDSHPPVPADYLANLRAMLEEGRRGDMVALFMTDAVGMPAEMVEGMKEAPFWPGLELVAHTLIYDGTFMVANQSGRPLTNDMRNMFEAITVPTVIIDGSATYPFLHSTADILLDVVPDATRETVEGQRHDFTADAVAPTLIEFL
jgi:pimeloyl-ACP methyl ester carboxylesterase